ncbi:MAG: hypothetical protein JKX76_01770 [Colwellia sp.]|nr:hypothetical protein [Colwellia sp.]
MNTYQYNTCIKIHLINTIEWISKNIHLSGIGFSKGETSLRAGAKIMELYHLYRNPFGGGGNNFYFNTNVFFINNFDLDEEPTDVFDFSNIIFIFWEKNIHNYIKGFDFVKIILDDQNKIHKSILTQYDKKICIIVFLIAKEACDHSNIALLEWCDKVFNLSLIYRSIRNMEYQNINNIPSALNISRIFFNAYKHYDMVVIEWLFSHKMFPTDGNIDAIFFSNDIEKIDLIRKMYPCSNETDYSLMDGDKLMCKYIKFTKNYMLPYGVNTVDASNAMVASEQSVKIIVNSLEDMDIFDGFIMSNKIVDCVCMSSNYKLLKWYFENQDETVSQLTKKSIKGITNIKCFQIVIKNGFKIDSNNMNNSCRLPNSKLLEWGKTNGIYPTQIGMNLACYFGQLQNIIWGKQNNILPSTEGKNNAVQHPKVIEWGKKHLGWEFPK